jgi:hypothetical protein
LRHFERREPASLPDAAWLADDTVAPSIFLLHEIPLRFRPMNLSVTNLINQDGMGDL